MYHVVRSAKVEQCVKVETSEGSGVDGDPYRLVTYWYTLDGALIARQDPTLARLSEV